MPTDASRDPGGVSMGRFGGGGGSIVGQDVWRQLAHLCTSHPGGERSMALVRTSQGRTDRLADELADAQIYPVERHGYPRRGRACSLGWKDSICKADRVGDTGSQFATQHRPGIGYAVCRSWCDSSKLALAEVCRHLGAAAAPADLCLGAGSPRTAKSCFAGARCASSTFASAQPYSMGSTASPGLESTTSPSPPALDQASFAPCRRLDRCGHGSHAR